MKGRYEIVVKNARLQYKFTVQRNITILRGDSATGKTTLIEMIASYHRLGPQSGITVVSERPCVVLLTPNWEHELSDIHKSIVFIDEGAKFVSTIEFARAINRSDNYYVIATRNSLYHLPYSTKEVYGIKNNSGNRYQGTKRVYASFTPLCDTPQTIIGNPDLVVVEDSNAGFAFFSDYFSKRGIRCISAGGNSGVLSVLDSEPYQTSLLIADGAAFGPYIDNVLKLSKKRNIVLYLPESFEWILLKSDVLNDSDVRAVLIEPSNHISSEEYFSWERYFTHLLTERSRNTYLQYSKRKLNPTYLNEAIVAKVQKVLSGNEA